MDDVSKNGRRALTEEKCSQCGKLHDVTPHPSCSSIFHWDGYARSLVRKLHAVERERDQARAEVARMRDAAQTWTETPEELRDLVLTSGAREIASMHDAAVMAIVPPKVVTIVDEWVKATQRSASRRGEGATIDSKYYVALDWIRSFRSTGAKRGG